MKTIFFACLLAAASLYAQSPNACEAWKDPLQCTLPPQPPAVVNIMSLTFIPVWIREFAAGLPLPPSLQVDIAIELWLATLVRR